MENKLNNKSTFNMTKHAESEKGTWMGRGPAQREVPREERVPEQKFNKNKTGVNIELGNQIWSRARRVGKGEEGDGKTIQKKMRSAIQVLIINEEGGWCKKRLVSTLGGNRTHNPPSDKGMHQGRNQSRQTEFRR